jgi:hypothetical protein
MTCDESGNLVVNGLAPFGEPCTPSLSHMHLPFHRNLHTPSFLRCAVAYGIMRSSIFPGCGRFVWKWIWSACRAGTAQGRSLWWFSIRTSRYINYSEHDRKEKSLTTCLYRSNPCCKLSILHLDCCLSISGLMLSVC